MCEPNHSINQYPSDDEGTGAPNESRIAFGLRKLCDYIKKIKGWFHLSILGSGHSESEEWAYTQSIWLPPAIQYEVAWWNRQVCFDGFHHHLMERKDEAMECATEYANRVSIGNLSQLRNFIEVSMIKSERPSSYLHIILSDLLNLKGRDILYRKLSSRFKNFWANLETKKGGIIKTALGMTRKREYLNDIWADDKLWIPEPKKLIIAS